MAHMYVRSEARSARNASGRRRIDRKHSCVTSSASCAEPSILQAKRKTGVLCLS